MLGALKEVTHWLTRIGRLPADLLRTGCSTESDSAGSSNRRSSSALAAQEISYQSGLETQDWINTKQICRSQKLLENKSRFAPDRRQFLFSESLDAVQS